MTVQPAGSDAALEATPTRYDAIIVGAGPAGSMAARLLGQAGARTLLLEKAALGRDKPCGGGLTPRAYRDLDVPIDDLIDARATAVELRYGPRSGRRLAEPNAAIWMVRRSAFDQRLAEAAVEAGAELHEREPATGAVSTVAGVEVTTARGRYTAACLLLAGGAEDRLRGGLGLPAAGRAMIAIELEGPAKTLRLDSRTALLDYGAVPHGYAWAFPKDDWWNVGIGSMHPRWGPELRGRLARFLDVTGIEFSEPHLVPERARGRRIPLWDGRRPLAQGRVALLGDAAGLGDPFFGEGIAQALASGRLAAEAAHELLTGRAVSLESYTGAVRAALGPHLNRLDRLARAVYPAPFPWLFTLVRWPRARRFAARLVAEPWRMSSTK